MRVNVNKARQDSGKNFREKKQAFYIVNVHQYNFQAFYISERTEAMCL